MPDTLPDAPVQTETPSLEAEVARLKALLRQGHHEEAVDRATAWLAIYPENRDLLLVAATALRHLRRVDDALAMLDRLEQTHPAFSRLHEERGLSYVQLKDAPNAIDALLRAVHLNPALPAAWSMLEKLYLMTGNRGDAGLAADHVADAETPAGRGGDGNQPVFRRRPEASRGHHPRLPAEKRQSSGGHAPLGAHRPGL